MKTKRARFGKWCLDVLIILAASVIFSFGVRFFTAPNDIASGGVTGISVIISSVTGWSVGLLYGVLNLPLVIIGFIFLGRSMMVKTIISVAAITFSTDYLFKGLAEYKGDLVLASVFGGLLFGIGLGLVYLREGTTGGIDIIIKLINKKLPHFSMGKIMIAIDAAIVIAAILAFGSIESGLFAIISIFVSARVVDLILYGSLEGKMLLIFSDKYDEISHRIMTGQQRGVTLLNGVGAYSGVEKKVICCAVQKNQYAKIKRIVSELDPLAFMIIASANEVLGEGFRENKF